MMCIAAGKNEKASKAPKSSSIANEPHKQAASPIWPAACIILRMYTLSAILVAAIFPSVALPCIVAVTNNESMAYTFLKCVVLFVLVAMYAYVSLLRLSRDRAYRDGVNESRSLHRNLRPSMANQRHAGERDEKNNLNWLFSTPQPQSPWIGLHKLLTHLPAYVTGLFRLLYIVWPQWLARLFWRRITTGQYQPLHSIKDRDLFDCVMNSSLIMLVSHNGSISTPITEILLQVPDDLPTQSYKGAPAAGLKILFDVKSKAVVSASNVQYSDLRGQNHTLMGMLHMVYSTYTHTKLHTSAERSVHEILFNDVKALEPSSRFTYSLHDGLFYNKYSPIGQDEGASDTTFLLTGVTRQSTCEAIRYPMPHRLDPAMRAFPFYDFMWQAHGIMAELVAKYKYPVNPHSLTNGMVLHSVDHYAFRKHCMRQHDNVSFDGSGAADSQLRESIFLHIWTHTATSQNPFENEYLSNMDKGKHPFFFELYERLYALNPEYADCCITSTSF